MAFKARERVFETATTTGTGNFTTNGATQDGRRLDDAFVNGDTFWYKIVDLTTFAYEAGIGTYLGSHQFARTTVLESTNANALVNFAAGTKLVFNEMPAMVAQALLQSANNLSDVASAATARTNLGVAYGKQSIWLPAAAWRPRATNGPGPGIIEMSTNKNMVETLDFDPTTQEFAQCDIRMPKSWNLSTVSFIALWSHPATATNFGVAWGLDAVAISDDDTLDVAFGTAQVVTDTGGTTNDLYQTAESSAITIAGTPTASDHVQFRIHRDPANGSDTMAVDARLHGILLLYTNAASNDT